jgi:hypothetical protein
MIHAQELRIGNCIYDVHGKVRFISHRKLSDIASNPDNHGYQDIPLTAEWLEKLGFIPDQRADWNPFRYPQMNGNSSYTLSMNCVEQWVFSIWRDDIKQSITIRILEYVHELQNLFYVLTGEELVIKEIV